MATHTTASVFINDAEDGLLHDYELWLEKIAPHAPTTQYEHNRTGEDNADAHLKRQIMGREVVVAITKGKLDFGAWEASGAKGFGLREATAGCLGRLSGPTNK